MKRKENYERVGTNSEGDGRNLFEDSIMGN